jgi:hypothetical protein
MRMTSELRYPTSAVPRYQTETRMPTLTIHEVLSVAIVCLPSCIKKLTSYNEADLDLIRVGRSYEKFIQDVRQRDWEEDRD